jgi:polysaccharide pyruvyl transferase WcaK-like protein
VGLFGRFDWKVDIDMRINISGFYGWGNSGDEAILQAIVDDLGKEHEYIISTSIPFNREYWSNYKWALNKNGIKVYDIRSNEDIRTDFDCFILGGGELNWGLGWRQCLSVFGASIKCMNYAVGYNKRWYYSDKLKRYYYEFLKNFDIITVRDEYSMDLLAGDSEIGGIGLNNVKLTFDPTINMKRREFDSADNNISNGKIIVFPRYEDDAVSNQPQLDWLLNELNDISNDIILVACALRSIEGIDIDLELCKYLKERLDGSTILNISPFEPRKVKYLISKSKMVISGGRYHPVVWAIGEGVPYKISPTGFGYSKITNLEHMFKKYGRDGLVRLANRNKEIFNELWSK